MIYSKENINSTHIVNLGDNITQTGKAAVLSVKPQNPVTVYFSADKDQQYGFDQYNNTNPTYKILDDPQYYLREAINGSTYYKPWKSISISSTDIVNVKISRAKNDTMKTNLKINDGNGNNLSLQPSAGDSVKQLVLNGTGFEGTQEITATYTEADTGRKTFTAGKFGLVSYSDINNPANFTAKPVNGGGLEVNWTTGISQTGYNIRYRVKGSDKDWWSDETMTDNIRVYQLPDNTDIEYEVNSECGTIESAYSDTQYAHTAITEQKPFQCSNAAPPPAITDFNDMPDLAPGATINAGGFQGRITSVTRNSDGSFTGECMVTIPFYNYAKVMHTFKNIRVNELGQLYQGKLESKESTGNFMTKIENPRGNPVANNNDTVSAPDTTQTGSTEDTLSINGTIDTVYKASDGNIVIITTDGDTTTIPKGQPKTIVDSDGNTTVIDSNGEITDVGNTSTSESTQGTIDQSLSDFYLLFTVKNISQNTMDFYYCTSKSKVEDAVVEKLKNMYSSMLVNGGAIDQNITELKPSSCNITGNDVLEVKYIQVFRIIKSGNNYINNYSYKENGVSKKYSYSFQINGNLATPGSYNTSQISGDIAITLNVSSDNNNVKALELDITKLQQYEYVVTYGGNAYKNGDNLTFEKGKQVQLKTMEKEPSGNLKEITVPEINWNNEKITGSSEYDFIPKDDMSNLKVSFTNDTKDVSLSFTVEMKEPFVPGITINYDNSTKEYSYISNAEKQISNNNNDKDMYNYLALKKQVTINVLSAKDGQTAGESTWNDLKLPNGFQFDPKTLHYQGNCICSPIIVTLFVSSDDILELESTLETGTIPNTDLYQQIKLANPDEIKEVEDIINANRPTLCNELDGSKFYALKEKVYRAATDDEIDKKVSDPINGAVTLYTDVLNDETKNKDFRPINPPSEDELIKVNYTRKLSHELMHLYYKANHKVEVTRWSLMRNKIDMNLYGSKLCDDYSNSYGCVNCSKGEGHEKNNPEGQAACNEECNY